MPGKRSSLDQSIILELNALTTEPPFIWFYLVFFVFVCHACYILEQFSPKVSSVPNRLVSEQKKCDLRSAIIHLRPFLSKRLSPFAKHSASRQWMFLVLAIVGKPAMNRMRWARIRVNLPII